MAARTRELEVAFGAMVDRWRAGLAPAPMAIGAPGPGHGSLDGGTGVDDPRGKFVK